MPVDRQRMRPWLEEQINSGLIQGLQWVNVEKKIFQIPWMHAARHGWDLIKDAPLFMNWAIHTGKFRPGIDKPDPKTWKANFRCAMNSLPDIEEVKDKSKKSGSNAFKMYRMLSAAEKAAKKMKKKMGKMDQEPKVKIRKNKSTKPDPPRLKEETLPDSTVFLTEFDHPYYHSTPNKLLGSDPLDVCAVVEITTENEESTVSSTQLSFPVQTSPLSSHKVESADESTHSDEDSMESVQPQDLSTGSSERSHSSVLRIPSSLPERTQSFTASEKRNFWVTSCREEAPLIAYEEPSWRPFLKFFPFEPVDLSSSSSSSSGSTVIMQAMDLSSTAGHKQ